MIGSVRWFHPLLLVFSSGCLVRGWVYKQVEPGPPDRTHPVAGLNGFSAETCGGCHGAIYAEWSLSMMRDSFDDPLFQAKWSTTGENFVCLHCHAPLQEQQPRLVEGLASIAPMVAAGQSNPAFDEALQHEGITCASCHLQEGHVVGASGGGDAPHPLVVDSKLGSSGEVCESCHQLEEPLFYRLERPLMDTFGEWRAWMEITGRSESCVDCHMPLVERPVVEGGEYKQGHSHEFPGATDLEMLRAGLEIVSATKTGDGLDVLVENRAGHNYPTAEHAHLLVLRVGLLSGDGVEFAVREHEMARRIEHRVEVSDTTLRPGETRKFESKFEERQIVRADRVRVEVYFQRMGVEPLVSDQTDLSDAQSPVLVHSLEFDI